MPTRAKDNVGVLGQQFHLPGFRHPLAWHLCWGNSAFQDRKSRHPIEIGGKS
jgi:hypothetical protein